LNKSLKSKTISIHLGVQSPEETWHQKIIQ